jgi:hypothetical protein
LREEAIQEILLIERFAPSILRSSAALELESLALRHQIGVLQIRCNNLLRVHPNLQQSDAYSTWAK